MQKNNGGNAFPQWAPEIMNQAEFGMSLRDYFAAKASDKDVSDMIHDNYLATCVRVDVADYEYVPLTRQQARYMHADLMLAERAK